MSLKLKKSFFANIFGGFGGSLDKTAGRIGYFIIFTFFKKGGSKNSKISKTAGQRLFFDELTSPFFENQFWGIFEIFGGGGH